MQHPEYTMVAPMQHQIVYQSPQQHMHTIQQSINQPVPQQMHQSMHQSVSQSINQSPSQPINPSMSNGEMTAYDPSRNQSMQQPMHHHMHPSMNQSMNQSINQSMQPPLTCRCPNCSLLLSFPAGIPYISCPKCHSSFQPINAPYQPMQQQIQPMHPPIDNQSIIYTTCSNCSTLLSHPATSTQIQCPHCRSVLEVPSSINQSQQPPVSPALQSNNHPHLNAQSIHHPPSPPHSTKDENEHSSSHSRSHNTTSNDALTDSTNGLASKKRKDPNAPKRASNAYMIFCKERRSQLKNDRPDLLFGQLGKRLGEIWRSMSDKEKEVYEVRACGDRDRYKGQMNEYQSLEMMRSVHAAEYLQAKKSAANRKVNALHDHTTHASTHPPNKRQRVRRTKKQVVSAEEDSLGSDDQQSDSSSSQSADPSTQPANRRERANRHSSSSQSSHHSS